VADKSIVVGAGIVGALIALELAERGNEVTLLEATGVAAGVSGGSLAALTNHLAGDPEDLPFVLDSTNRWTELAEQLRVETGIDVEHEVSGQISLIEGENQVDGEKSIAYVGGMVEREVAQGLEVELIGADRAREMVPGLAGSRVVGATWCPSDAKINALLACRAVIDYGVTRGVNLQLDTPVRNISPEGSGWRLGSDRGVSVIADKVVIAAGPWSAAILKDIEPRLVATLKPKRAQCCVTQTLPKMIGPVMASISVGISAGYTQLHQTCSGEVMFNTVTETADPRRPDGSLENHVDHDFMVTSARTLVDLFPALSNTRLLRAWAACEAWTPDQRFMIGGVGDGPGLFVAAGDSGVGFLKAPMVARSVAALVNDETPPHPLDRYAPLRDFGDARGGTEL
jgi:sarcosine oxidase subunit beta